MVGLLLKNLTPIWWILVLAGVALLCLWIPQLRDFVSFSMLLLALGVGWLRADFDQPSEKLSTWNGRVLVQGIVLEPPRRWGNSAVFFFAVDSRDGEACQTRKVLVRWSGCHEGVEAGERWELSGVLRKPEQASYPGGFSQRFWLWTQRTQESLEVGRFSSVSYLQPPRGWGVRALSHRLRAWMLRRLEVVEDPGARSLVAGVVFGETQSLSVELQEDFRRTGTSHLLAASGMNVALLCGMVMLLAKLAGYGPWRAAPYAAVAIVGYAFLAGCAPSILRATLGTLMALLALWMGRASNAWNSMSLSVWLLLGWEPRQIYDLGFQLSLAAVVGLVGGPNPSEEASAVWKSTQMTLSASLVTLPFFWHSFGELSSTLLLANLLLGPVVELLFPLGLVLTLAPLPPLAWMTEAIADLSLWLVGHLSLLSDPWMLAKPSWGVTLILMVAIAIWLCPSLGRCCYLALPVAGLAVLLGSWQASQAPLGPGELRIRRVDEVLWVSTPDSEHLLLREVWQEKRARSMVRDLGCLRSPRVVILAESQAPRIEWGGFDWGEVERLLPKSSFLEVRTDGATYTFRSWDP